MARRHREGLRAAAGGASVVLLLALASVPAGASGALPVNGGGGAPYRSIRTYTSYAFDNQSCDGAHLSASPHWFNGTGNFRAGVTTSARSCPTNASINSQISLGEVGVGVGSLLPLPAASNGSHVLRENWTLSLASAASFTHGGCPTQTLPFQPTGTVEAWCQDYTIRTLRVDVELLDLSTYRGAGLHSAFLNESTDVGWANETTCQLAMPGGWSCVRYVGPIDQNDSDQVRTVLDGPFAWNGRTNFTTWTNGSGMVSTDRYALEIDLTLQAVAATNEYSLQSRWNAHAWTYLRLARPGTFLQLDSLTEL